MNSDEQTRVIVTNPPPASRKWLALDLSDSDRRIDDETLTSMFDPYSKVCNSVHARAVLMVLLLADQLELRICAR